MRLPRDVSGRDLTRALARLGYEVDHQTGSHLRLTTHQGGEHHLTKYQPTTRLRSAHSAPSCETWPPTPGSPATNF